MSHIIRYSLFFTDYVPDLTKLVGEDVRGKRFSILKGKEDFSLRKPFAGMLIIFDQHAVCGLVQCNIVFNAVLAFSNVQYGIVKIHILNPKKAGFSGSYTTAVKKAEYNSHLKGTEFFGRILS